MYLGRSGSGYYLALVAYLLPGEELKVELHPKGDKGEVLPNALSLPLPFLFLALLHLKLSSSHLQPSGIPYPKRLLDHSQNAERLMHAVSSLL